MRKILNTLILLIFTLIAIDARAQSNATLAGTVSEKKSGEAVIGVSVVLLSDTNSSKPVRGAYTNKFGFFSIPKLSGGRYFVEVRGIGYDLFRMEITMMPGEERKIKIELGRKDVKLQEITVVSQRESNPTSSISTINVSTDIVSKMPVIGGESDVFRALQLLPGVKANSEISSGLYIRGGSPDQNLTLLDGVIVYSPSHLGGFLSAFNTDVMRDIKLIKGAFPAEYGGRLSSVLDMTMKEGTKEKITGSAGLSLISARGTLEGPINDNSTFMVSGRRMYLGTLMLFATKEGNDAPDYYFYDLNAKMNYTLSENDKLYVSGYMGRDILNSPKSQEESINFNIDWGNTTANLRWMHIISPSLFTNFSVIFTDYKFETAMFEGDNASNNFSSLSMIRDYMVRAEMQYFPMEGHTVKAGYEGILHQFTTNTAFDMVNGFNAELDNRKLDAFESAIYLQDEWQINTLWSANIGGRAFYFSKGGYLRFEPRLSTSYFVTDQVKFSLSGAVANQYLHLLTRDIALPTDLWFPSTDKIKPSRSIQGVFGIEYTPFGSEYLFSVETYYKSMEQIYEYKSSSQEENPSFLVPFEDQIVGGNGKAYGLEVFLNKKMGSFTGWIGYTLAWTDRTIPGINGGRTYPPRYDRRHDISLVATYQLSDSWEIGASWVFGTGQSYTMPDGSYKFKLNDYPWEDGYGSSLYRYNYSSKNNYRLPAFHKLDLNLIHKFSWFGLPFEFNISIYNAYNQKNPFLWYLETNYETNKKEIKQLTLFPIIPTFGLSCKF